MRAGRFVIIYELLLFLLLLLVFFKYLKCFQLHGFTKILPFQFMFSQKQVKKMKIRYQLESECKCLLFLWSLCAMDIKELVFQTAPPFGHFYSDL